MEKIELIEIDEITGKSHLLNGVISIDVTDELGVSRCLNFKAQTYDEHLSVLLTSSPMARPRIFQPLDISPVPSDSRNRRIRFLLNVKTAIQLELDPSQVAALIASLGNVQAAPNRSQ